MTDDKERIALACTAHVSHAALVELLMVKGIITKVEYLEALAAAMETEHRAWQDRIRQHYGDKVTIG